MEANGCAGRDTCDLLDIAPQEGITGARIRCESRPAINWLPVSESELFVPDPAVLPILCLILAGQQREQVFYVDAAGCGWNDMAVFAASVANWVLPAEELRVGIVAFLSIDRVTIAMLI